MLTTYTSAIYVVAKPQQHSCNPSCKTARTYGSRRNTNFDLQGHPMLHPPALGPGPAARGSRTFSRGCHGREAAQRARARVHRRRGGGLGGAGPQRLRAQGGASGETQARKQRGVKHVHLEGGHARRAQRQAQHLRPYTDSSSPRPARRAVVDTEGSARWAARVACTGGRRPSRWARTALVPAESAPSWAASATLSVYERGESAHLALHETVHERSA